MKRFIFVVLCVATIMGVALTSCTKEDGEKEAALLIGTWRYTYDDGDYEDYIFKAAGKLTIKYNYSLEDYYDQESGTYTYKHPDLTIEIDGDEEEWIVESITSSKLVAEVDGETMTLKKK